MGQKGYSWSRLHAILIHEGNEIVASTDDFTELDVGDEIELEFQDYPITISGLLIDRIKMKTADSTADEVFSVISFH